MQKHAPSPFAIQLSLLFSPVLVSNYFCIKSSKSFLFWAVPFMHLSLWLILWKLLKEHLCPEHKPRSRNWFTATVVISQGRLVSRACIARCSNDFHDIYFVNSEFQLTQHLLLITVPKMSKREFLSPKYWWSRKETEYDSCKHSHGESLGPSGSRDQLGGEGLQRRLPGEVGLASWKQRAF